VFASESGNSERLAGDIAKASRKNGLKPTIVDMADLDVASLAAGNGSNPKYVGVAPEATLIVAVVEDASGVIDSARVPLAVQMLPALVPLETQQPPLLI
jgi:hypothetical protein